MSDFMDRVLHVLLPNKCMFCGKPVNYSARRCEACEENAPRTDLTRCPVCDKAECSCKRSFDWLVSPFYYDMGLVKAVHDLKFHDNLLNARKLGQDMAEALLQTGLNKLVSRVVPVPMHPKDYRKRGYNQAEELARWVGKIAEIPLASGALTKVCRTDKQRGLHASERAENLKGAFAVVQADRIRNRGILLVDDVFTTGSTMEACAAELVRNGARVVICLTAAKTQKRTAEPQEQSEKNHDEIILPVEQQ